MFLRESFLSLFIIAWLPSILLAISDIREKRDPQNPIRTWRSISGDKLSAFAADTSSNAVQTGHGDGGGIVDTSVASGNAVGTTQQTNNTVTNVTVQLGTMAYLHCHVRSLPSGEDRALAGSEVSWVRRRDWHILSSGMFMYTNDERFQVLHPDGTDDWTLQIKYVQKRDNGTYECQISTGTGIVSQFVNLHVVVPEAFILGSGEHHVDIGSVIRLVCVIEKSPTPLQYVFWYHNERMINYEASRVDVDTRPGGAQTHSRLTVRGATDADSGNYTCSASNTKPASIYVFVSEGDKMAAISRRKTSSGNIITCEMVLLFLGFCVLYGTVR